MDEEIYKNVKYQVQSLIRKKKREFYETYLTQKINKSKEFWKNLKSKDLPPKVVTAYSISFKNINEIVFNVTKNSSILKKDESISQNVVFNLLNLKLRSTITIT